jgi:nitrous oxidase accessory protein NosD
MKKLLVLLPVLILLTTALSPMPAQSRGEVTLTAAQVTGANDIEAAIIQATAEGTRPGTVILDSKAGDFNYTQPDRSINIFYSRITLRSNNGAVIRNCGDGVYFDDFPDHAVNNFLLEGITFYCEGMGVAGGDAHKYVTIRNNTFNTLAFTIGATHPEGWVISNNTILTESDGVFLIEALRARITNNEIEAFKGIRLEGGLNFWVISNTIEAANTGIDLGLDASNALISGNTIRGVKETGVRFWGRNEYNHVTGNRVACGDGDACTLVDIVNPPLSDTNLVRGNHFIKNE